MTTKGNRNIVVLGAGSIGASFAAVFADQGWQVTLVDPDEARLDAARDSVAVQDDAIALAGLRQGSNGRIAYAGEAEGALAKADLVLECGPENVEIKQAIFADLLQKSGPETVLATASSAIRMSQIVTDPALQARCVVAHPVNPPAVLRLIEICPANGTSKSTIQAARTYFKSARFDAVVLSREIEGFVLNRLQGTVLREAYRLVEDGIVAPDDVDKVMRLGLGPRWALCGPFETAELNTPGGIAAHAARMGPAYKRMGEERGENVEWSAPLIDRVVRARDAARGKASVAERVTWRSTAVAKLVAVRDRLMRGET